ncbi:MAG: cytochrome c biogenesis protein ResB [Candidatus Xenobiia bacterium LiM19]
MTVQSPEDMKQESGKETPLLTGLWNFLGSARMAVILLVVVAFFSALGTFIPQAQPPDYYLRAYGSTWGKLFLALSFNHIYYAHWYVALLALVASNLVISNLRRLESLRQVTRNLKVTMGVPFFLDSPKSLKINAALDGEAVESKIESFLASLGYSVRKEEQDGDLYFYAEKGGIRRWGSLVTHMGILFVFLGVIYGHLPGMGFSGFVQLTSEGRYSEKEMPGFTLRLLDTGSKRNEVGRPTDFYSRVEILENGSRVVEKTIRVNDPLEYRGIKFYQASFSVLGVTLKVKEPDGSVDIVPAWLDPNGTLQMDMPVQAGKSGLSIFVHRLWPDLAEKDGAMVNLSMNYNNPGAEVFIFRDFDRLGGTRWNAQGWVSRGNPLKYEGYEVEMGDVVSCTGLQYRKDPGVPLIWLGFIFSTTGLIMSFYFFEKNIRILNHRETGMLYVQTNSRLEEDFEREIGRLKKIFRK